MMVALIVYGAPGLTGMEKEMRALYIEGVAIRGGPESCVEDRKVVDEAMTGVGAGRAIEPRKLYRSGCRRRPDRRKATAVGARHASVNRTPRGLRPRARIHAPHSEAGRSRVWPDAGATRPLARVRSAS